jgi:hypothetical protein
LDSSQMFSLWKARFVRRRKLRICKEDSFFKTSGSNLTKMLIRKSNLGHFCQFHFLILLSKQHYKRLSESLFFVFDIFLILFFISLNYVFILIFKIRLRFKIIKKFAWTMYKKYFRFNFLKSFSVLPCF